MFWNKFFQPLSGQVTSLPYLGEGKGGGWQLGEGEGKGYRVLVRLELAIDENFQLSIINFQLINFVANKSPCPLQTRICSKQ